MAFATSPVWRLPNRSLSPWIEAPSWAYSVESFRRAKPASWLPNPAPRAGICNESPARNPAEIPGNRITTTSRKCERIQMIKAIAP